MKVVLEKGEKRVMPVLFGEDLFCHSELGSESRSRNKFGMTERRINVVLAGEGSEVEVVGLVLGNKAEERALEVYITHAAPKTKSKVNVRAVLWGKSTFAFRGNVKIEKGAKGADAYLRSDALLFDDAKMGDDTPALEILERDVKAGHAATIGKVDEQMLFYLMSRGISRVQAEKLLVKGFTQPILNILRANEMSREVTDLSF